MKRTAFFDSNVLLYAVGSDSIRADIAEALLRAGGHISVQVCNEFVHVAQRKMRSPLAKIQVALDAVFRTCEVHPLTLDTHVHGLKLTQRYGFAIFDAMIVASALQAGCTLLYSEDMQHGMQVEDRLTIRNPFVAA